MILIHLLTLALVTAATYTVAGVGAATACGAGLALESANLLATEAVGRYLLHPSRRRDGLFRLFYFLKYAALVTTFSVLAVASHHVLAVATGFTAALAVHVAARSRTTLKEAAHAA